MGTKWKSFKECWRKNAKRKGAVLFLALVLLTIGVILLIHLFFEIYHTGTTWFAGGIANVFLAVGIALLFSVLQKRKGKDSLPEDEQFFEVWQAQWKRRQKLLLEIAVGCMVAMYVLLTYREEAYYWMFPANYASYYLMYTTVLLQCGIVKLQMDHAMLGQLSAYMEHEKQIYQEATKQALEKALEIEKESMVKVSRSDQLRMELITNVSHDLKTPLTSMVGYLELLKKESLNETAADYVSVISNRAGKLKEMIDSLFSLAKVSSGNVELKKEEISMNRLMEQLLADMEDKIAESGLDFVELYTDEDTSLVTDNGYMYRICQNLVENALKYAAKGTRVFIRTYRENSSGEKKVGLEITNTAGYRMDFQKEDIVERFARADTSRTTEGNGLGLAIVSTYAKALGGEFDIFLDYDQFKARLLFSNEKGESENERELQRSDKLSCLRNCDHACQPECVLDLQQ